ncbi:MAG TPA: NlpC/P60 family protein [Chitinophagaceae bacterium]|nr:NlpC/P60 family protein [Chitinophagaceae bacterium]
MRWILVVLPALGLVACSTQRPVATVKQETRQPQRANAPVFLENIAADPYRTGASPRPSSTTANTVSNAFKMEGNGPGIYTPMQFKYAILMDVPVEALNNLQLFSFIDEWYGTPYRFGGNDKAGIDCSAFTGNLMTSVFGVGLPRMARDQYNACDHVKREELEEGDLVFFHTTRKGISHVGVYLGNDKFVHASLNYGVTISSLSDPYYARSFRAGGRMRVATITVSGN